MASPSWSAPFQPTLQERALLAGMAHTNPRRTPSFADMGLIQQKCGREKLLPLNLTFVHQKQTTRATTLPVTSLPLVLRPPRTLCGRWWIHVPRRCIFFLRAGRCGNLCCERQRLVNVAG